MSNPKVRQEPMASNANLNHFPASSLKSDQNPSPSAHSEQSEPKGDCTQRFTPSTLLLDPRYFSPRPQAWFTCLGMRGSGATRGAVERAAAFAAAFAVERGERCFVSLFFFLGVPMKWALGVWLLGFRGFWFPGVLVSGFFLVPGCLKWNPRSCARKSCPETFNDSNLHHWLEKPLIPEGPTIDDSL